MSSGRQNAPAVGARVLHRLPALAEEFDGEPIAMTQPGLLSGTTRGVLERRLGRVYRR